MYNKIERGEHMRIDRVKFITELAKKEYTLRKLSEISGVSAQTLSYIKCGKGCSEKTIAAIASALEVDIGKIIEK